MALKITLLDKLFSQFIRLRAIANNDGCELCGRKVDNYTKLQCSHFIGRRYQNTRYEPDNAVGICYTCHNYFHDFPDIHHEFFAQRMGIGRIEELKLIARTYHKMTKERKAEIKARLKEKIGGLG